MQERVTLEDGQEYTFSAVPIGYWKQYDELVSTGEPAKMLEADLSVTMASIKRAHPDMTREKLEFELLTHANMDEVREAIKKATGIKTGEANPVAK